MLDDLAEEYGVGRATVRSWIQRAKDAGIGDVAGACGNRISGAKIRN